MQVITVVEDYVHALAKRAVGEVVEGDVVVATVPEAPGIVASGADRTDCALDLYRRLEEWVLLFLARGYELPIVDGINLNTPDARALAQRRAAEPEAAEVEIYESEEELEAAFARQRASN